MTDRHTASTITDQQLDDLYAERDRYFHFACAARGASGARTFPDLTDTILALVDRAEKAEAYIREHVPVAYDGPSIAEAAADDRRWWNGEKAGDR